MGASSVIDDNNGKEKGNREFNCVCEETQLCLNESKGQMPGFP